MSFREGKYEKWMIDAEECRKYFEAAMKKNIIIEISNSEDWSKRHIEKSIHNMDFSNLIDSIHDTIIKEKFPKKSFYDWITIAYYYAIYHAALALLAQIGYKSKSHMATLCGIILHYYHKNKFLEKKHIEILKQIDKETVEKFIEAQKLRERAS